MSAGVAGGPPPARSTTAPFVLLAAFALGAVGIALVSQHGFGMEPCAWCVLQRLVFCAVGVAALIGLGWRSRLGARVAGALACALAAAGLAAAGWLHFVASKSSSCNLTLADRIVNATGLATTLPDVFEARASCADAAAPLLGVDYALWAAAAFVVCAALAISALRRSR